MSKPTDFAYYLTTYFTNHLAGRRNLSKNTIHSYSDAFCLLLVFFQEERCCPPERLTLQKIGPMAVEDFLVWLEEKRGNSISTRNQRLAAIHAFFRFIQTQKPELLLQCQQILAIPGKKEQKQTVPFILESDLQKLLSMPDRSTSYGRRDSTLLCLLYDSGARVQELIDLSARDVRLQSPATLRLLGKGRKVRVVPLMKQTAALLKDYMDEHGLDPDRTPDAPLFVNHQGKRLTRPGITYILNKYMNEMMNHGKICAAKISPHTLRHTKAMHLLRAGVDLHYIRDFLGHVDIMTTEVYAKADAEMKRAAIEKANADLLPESKTSWQKNDDLLAWLTSLGKS